MRLSHIPDVIEASITSRSDEHLEWDKWHSWYLSEYQESQGHGRTTGFQDVEANPVNLETNYPYAYIDTMTANICPTNPMMTVNARNPKVGKIAKARENLINDEMHRDKMHAKAWDISTFSAICGRGVSKTVWNTKMHRPECSIIDPKRFFFDMSVPFEKTRFAFEATLLTREEFAARMKKGHGADGGPKYDPEVAERIKARLQALKE